MRFYVIIRNVKHLHVTLYILSKIIINDVGKELYVTASS